MTWSGGYLDWLQGLCWQDLRAGCPVRVYKTKSIMEVCGIDTMTMMNELYDRCTVTAVTAVTRTLM